jgi:hypothetical protein
LFFLFGILFGCFGCAVCRLSRGKPPSAHKTLPPSRAETKTHTRTQHSRVADLFQSVQLNVNNPHFLIMQGRVTKVREEKRERSAGKANDRKKTPTKKKANRKNSPNTNHALFKKPKQKNQINKKNRS